ncbi:hypothetical protein GCM10020254_14620 [Streptomyces goshikiensis]
MRSITAHHLPISRAVFRQGRPSHSFMRALNMSLFLSANGADVRDAVAAGLPAGHVLHTARIDDESDPELRMAFDFDGVLAGDASERVFQSLGLDEFRAHEVREAATPHDPGPLRPFLAGVNRIQRREEERRRGDPAYQPRLRVSLVTARDAPTHERAIRSLKDWGLRVNDAFFLGGIEKTAVMRTLDPHIFFDDQVSHLNGTAHGTPSVHVPFRSGQRAASRDHLNRRPCPGYMGSMVPAPKPYTCSLFSRMCSAFCVSRCRSAGSAAYWAACSSSCALSRIS